MRLLVECGILAAEVFLAANARAAPFLYSDPENGTIEPAKVADVVPSEGNPLDDIPVSKRIVAVIRTDGS